MIDDYRKARKVGQRQVARALAEGRHPYPPALDEQMRGIPFSRETPIGCVEIPLELVVGTRTRGRQNAFSEAFMPLEDEHAEFATKWTHLLDSQVAEGFHDPIVASECLRRFYVQEGNKRVSVARYLGMPSIMARVTRVVPAFGLGFDEELSRYEEFERFFGVAPLYDIVLSHEGDYARLAHILGRDLQTPWPETDVRHLRTLYYLFRATYERQGGRRLGLSGSDAFLLFLQTYATTDFRHAGPALVERLVRRMREEFVVAAQPSPIAFVSEPPPVERGVVSRAVTKIKPAASPTVAFVYDRAPEASGWVALHERGRRDLERRMGSDVRTLAFADCATDEAFDEAVDKAIAAGCSLVFSISPRQMDQTHRCAIEHPDVAFLNCSVNLTSGAVRTYYARMYEVKFLMGALAASLSQSHQVGYLATSPINGAVSEVNAFALGAALVDPYATVHLRWRSASPGWRDEMLAAGVDVVCDRDYVDPASPDEPVGLYVVADGGVLPVARPVWDWGRYYELMLRGMGSRRAEERSLRGHAINYWWGMRAEVVRLDLEDGVALGQRRLVDLLGRSLVDGQLAPFDTLLVGQDGTTMRRASDPRLTDEQVASMSWLNVNVAGTLPRMSELSAKGRADVEASGVVKRGPGEW